LLHNPATERGKKEGGKGDLRGDGRKAKTSTLAEESQGGKRGGKSLTVLLMGKGEQKQADCCLSLKRGKSKELS